MLVENCVQSKRFSNARNGRAISGNGEMRGNAVRVSFPDGHCSPWFSGWPPLVAVVEPADLRNRHNSSEFGRLDCARLRRVLRQREMRSGLAMYWRKWTDWRSMESVITILLFLFFGQDIHRRRVTLRHSNVRISYPAGRFSRVHRWPGCGCPRGFSSCDKLGCCEDCKRGVAMLSTGACF
jgi:hypothetical protein